MWFLAPTKRRRLKVHSTGRSAPWMLRFDAISTREAGILCNDRAVLTENAADLIDAPDAIGNATTANPMNRWHRQLVRARRRSATFPRIRGLIFRRDIPVPPPARLGFQHHADPVPGKVLRAEPARKQLAAHARKLALKSDLQILRRNRRPRPRGSTSQATSRD